MIIPEERYSMVWLGNRLFKLRRLVYFFPVMLLLVNWKNLAYPFGSHPVDEVFEFTGLGVATLGLAIRLWASGSAPRTVTKRHDHKSFRFRTDGIYSVVRNPYFFADFFVTLGLSLPLFNFTWFGFAMLFFFCIHVPILFARERVLMDGARHYSDYARKVPLILPAVGHWDRPKHHFSWLLALRKEANTLLVVALLFFVIEHAREFAVTHTLGRSVFWIFAMAPFCLAFIIARLFDAEFSKLPESPEMYD